MVMRRLLRENWAWFVVPAAVGAAIVVALVLFGSGSAAPGHYEI